MLTSKHLVKLSIILFSVTILFVPNDCLGRTVEERSLYVRVSPRDFRYFELSDGSPYIPNGINLVFPSYQTRGKTSTGLKEMDLWMRNLSENGGNFVRIWLGHSFWDIERKKAGVFDEEVGSRIDSLFAMARKYNIRLKLCFEYFRSIHPDNVGKKGRNPNTKYHVSEGGPFENMEEYINTEKGKNLFKKKLEFYQNRYGSDPIVFGWELWNEMDCVRASGWQDWTVEMLYELKKRFPHNLVMQSLGSFDHIRKRQMYRQINSIPINEVAQVHRYLDLGASMEVCHGPVDILAADAVRELLDYKLTKPVLLAESGGVEPRHTGPIRDYNKDKEGIILHDVLFAPFFVGAAGSGQIWHWDYYVHNNNLWYHFNRFSQVIRDLDPPAEEFRATQIEHPRLRIYMLKGKKTILLWCRDKDNTWQTELRKGTTPSIIKNARIKLDEKMLSENKEVQIFDPWKNKWQIGQTTRNVIVLPAFSRSIVVKIIK